MLSDFIKQLKQMSHTLSDFYGPFRLFRNPSSSLSLEGDEGRVILLVAFPFQEFEIAAAPCRGVFPADTGAVLIDGASSLNRIEKLAGTLENVILAMAKDIFTVCLDVFRVLLFSRFVTQTESFGKTLDIASGHQNPVISTTIGRAFRTIVKHRQ